MANHTTIHLTLPADLMSKLEALARSTQQNEADLAIEAIAAYMETAGRQVEEIQRGLAEADAGGPFIEHERVIEWLKSWGTERELPPPEPHQ